ncbi:MAG TPA: VOC family protein [Fibrobacteria bacterium]|nr:VOC family protein [Fibrobacteria bacterium]
MLRKITPCLLFDGAAEKAARYYVSIFKKSKILSVNPFLTRFLLEGQEFTALNGPKSEFTWAVSFYVTCKTQKEIDCHWENLASGGKEQPCGWVKDKFGLSWQIVPSIIFDLLADADPKKVDRTMQAVSRMKKLDIAKIKKAHAGKE